MSMGTIGRVMKSTRQEMIGESAEQVAAEFYHRFGMRDGDYIEFERKTAHGLMWTLGRIIMVDEVYYNQRGGYTASVKVAPLLVGGKLGHGKSVMITVNANGTGMRGVRTGVRRPERLVKEHV